MKKRALIWIITCLVIVVTITVILLISDQSDMQMGKAKADKLFPGQAITIDTKAEHFGVQIGDVFSYFVDVLYNPEIVSEIDRAWLVEVINLDPFEIRAIQEKDFELDSTNFIYRIEYTLQLVTGDVAHLYEFPSIVSKYKVSGSEGYSEFPSTPEPVYVSARLPGNIESPVSDVELGYKLLRPVSGEIMSTGQNGLSWIIIAIGGFLIMGTIADFTLRITPKRKKEQEKIKAEKNKLISHAYNLLYKNIDKGTSTEDIHHQVDHILRLIIVQKEDLNPLDELNMDKVPSEIRGDIVSIFDSSQKPGINKSSINNTERQLETLDKIMRFYYEEEFNNWKN